MTQKNDVPGDIAFPRFIVAVAHKLVTLPSPKDGPEGLAVILTKSAAKKVAR